MHWVENQGSTLELQANLNISLSFYFKHLLFLLNLSKLKTSFKSMVQKFTSRSQDYIKDLKWWCIGPNKSFTGILGLDKFDFMSWIFWAHKFTCANLLEHTKKESTKPKCISHRETIWNKRTYSRTEDRIFATTVIEAILHMPLTYSNAANWLKVSQFMSKQICFDVI